MEQGLFGFLVVWAAVSVLVAQVHTERIEFGARLSRRKVDSHTLSGASSTTTTQTTTVAPQVTSQIESTSNVSNVSASGSSGSIIRSNRFVNRSEVFTVDLQPEGSYISELQYQPPIRPQIVPHIPANSMRQPLLLDRDTALAKWAYLPPLSAALPMAQLSHHQATSLVKKTGGAIEGLVNGGFNQYSQNLVTSEPVVPSGDPLQNTVAKLLVNSGDAHWRLGHHHHQSTVQVEEHDHRVYTEHGTVKSHHQENYDHVPVIYTPAMHSTYPPVAEMDHSEGIPNIPGKPWKDYPMFSSVPHTSFKCPHHGYYADVEAGCQVWHFCQPDGRHDAFLCVNGTLFNQLTRVCDWWYHVDCASAPHHYSVNLDLYKEPLKYSQYV